MRRVSEKISADLLQINTKYKVSLFDTFWLSD